MNTDRALLVDLYELTMAAAFFDMLGGIQIMTLGLDHEILVRFIQK